MITRGNVPAAHTALVRALDIAERLKDAPMQLYLLQALYKWQIRSGDLRGFRELTDRLATVAKEIPDPLANAIAHGFLTVTCFFTGDNHEVSRHAHMVCSGSDIHSTYIRVGTRYPAWTLMLRGCTRPAGINTAPESARPYSCCARDARDMCRFAMASAWDSVRAERSAVSVATTCCETSG